MASEFERNLEKYAELIVRVGLNVQPGQRLQIGAPLVGMSGTPLELAPLVRQIAAQAYQIGARLVDVLWDDDQLRLIRFQNAPRDSFAEFPTWRADATIETAKAGDAILFIYSRNPDLLISQDLALITTSMRAGSKHLKPFFDLRVKNAMNFVIVAAPVKGWPEKIFPHLPPEEQTAQFWETIFEICRVKHSDPVSAWEDHIQGLAARCDDLNQQRFIGLHFTAPGTDLSLGLPEEHVWRSARLTTQSGIDFTTNLPTEEVFTLPHREKTEGVVTSTKPLSMPAGMIEDFTLTFSKGQVVNATAKQGEDILHTLLETDEGANRLGEVALVPHSSPISQSGLIFHIPLIDENAASHVALGRAYKLSLKGGEAMSDDQFEAVGGNGSLVHIDFMVGSGEMDVDGLAKDGTRQPIMRSGEWVVKI